jgi:hypothetical protein
VKEGTPLIVEIDYNVLKRELTIKDNSIGMSHDDLLEGLRIAHPTKDSKGRSKYGMGMKTAACWIGNNWKIETCEWSSGQEWTAAVDVTAVADRGAKVPITSKDVSRDDHYSHWFIIEVELTSHSLTRHVLPQIRAFQYGTPEPDCVTVLARETKLPAEQIKTFLSIVPRSVAVIANKRNRDWEIALESHQVQYLTVSAYRSSKGVEAIEIDGRLSVLKEHLGYGVFFATDRTLRFPKTVNLPDGEVMIDDVHGVSSMWFVSRDAQYAWITRRIGTPDLQNEATIQLTREHGGRISIRL